MRMLGRRADLHAVIADAEAAGRTVRLVVGGMDKQSVLKAFAEAIDAPAWFGKNYDALTDALRDLSDAHGRTIEVIWDGVAVLRSMDKPTYVAVRELLREIDEERQDLTVTIVDR
jgi:RNAse (barnase) inhibitor barstar